MCHQQQLACAEVLAHRARRSDLVAEHAIDARGGAEELDEHLGFSRLAERRPQQRDEDQGLDRVGSPPGRIVLAAVTGRWPRGPAGPRCRAARRKSSSRWRTISCSRYQCIDVGPSPGDPCSPVSPPPGRARGKVTAWMFFRRRDHRHGRAPWPGPHRGPAGRAAGPRASGARAGPSAGGYGSAALCLISSAGHPISREAGGGQPGPGGPALRETVRIPACAGHHPKVPARWNLPRRALARRCCQVGWGAVPRNQAELPGPRGGLGAVSGAELAQEVGHMLLTVSSATTRSWAMP